MNALVDFENMTDEELDAYINNVEQKKTVEKQAATQAEIDEKVAGLGGPKSTLDNFAAFAKSALNAGTVGAYGMLDRNITGAADYAIEKFGDTTGLRLAKDRPDDMTFDDFVNMATQSNRNLMEENPIAHNLGEATGIVGVGGPLMKGGTQVVNALTKGKLPQSIAQIFGAGVAGAGENVGITAGEGNLTPENALQTAGIGAAFGTGGQLAGDLLSRGGRFVHRKMGGGLEEYGKVDAAKSLFEAADPKQVGREAIRHSGARISEPQGFADVDVNNLMDTQVPGDISEDLAQITALRAGEEATRGTLNPLKQLARKRLDAEEEVAHQLVQKHLLGSTPNKSASAAEFDAKLAGKRAEYQALLESQQMLAPTVSREGTAKRIKGFLNKDMTVSARKQVLDLIEPELYGIGSGRRAKAFRDNMNHAGLLGIKKKIDDRISKSVTGQGAVDPSTNLDKEAIAALAPIKKYINNRLNKVKGYQRLSSQFADVARQRELVAMGNDMFKKADVQADEIKAVADGLEDIEKVYFARGALHDLMKKVANGDLKLVKKMLKTDTVEAKKLRAILGNDKIDAFMQEATKFGTELNNANTWKKAIESGARSSTQRSDSITNKLIDVAAASYQAANRQFGTPFLVPTRRLGASTDDAQAIAEMMFLQARGQEAPAVKRSLLDALKRSKKPPSTAGGQFGILSMPRPEDE